MRHFGARITDRFRLDGLRTVIIENELLRVTFLVDQGCDLIELLYKPKDMDFLWRSPNGIRRRPFIPASSTDRPFFDYYEGGWQELFPHASAPAVYTGAELGFHGEVWGLPWEYRILKDEAGVVEVCFWVKTIRMPFRLQRTVSLRAAESVIRFHEAVINEGACELEFMWGHHPAFGPPFLDRNCILDAPAGSIRIGNGIQPWPVDSSGYDHSRLIPAPERGEVMKYLLDLKAGWVALTQPMRNIGIGLSFDVKVFPYVWLWQEFGYTQDYPWFGRAYALGMEPHSSLPRSVEPRGRMLRLAGGASLETDLCAVIYEGGQVSRIEPDGKVEIKK